MTKISTTCTTCRQNGNPLRDWVREPQDQWKSGNRNQRWKRCWSHSLMWKACFITNSFLQDRQSLLQFIWQLWKAWCATFVESGPSTINRAVRVRCMIMRWHTQQLFQHIIMPKIKSPSYTSRKPTDLAPANIFLFPKIKLNMKSTFFENIPVIQSACTTELKAIPQTEFSRVFDGLYEHCHECICIEWFYVEDWCK